MSSTSKGAGACGPIGARPRERRAARAAIIALCLGWAAEAAAGAWTLPQGDGLIITTFGATRADSRFDHDRRAVGGARFRKAEIHVLAEYGISDRFTLRARSEYQSLKFEDRPQDDRTGFGFSEIGGRYRVVERGPFVGSLEASARVAAAHDLPGFADDRRIASEYEARLLAGYGFDIAGWQSFIDVQGAYRLRDGIGPDEVRADLTLGTRPVPNILLLVQSFSIFALGQPENAILGYDQHKLQASAVYDLNERFSLQAGGFTTIAGSDSLREEGLFGAIWHRF